jgi:hypothetical protein
MYSGFLAVSLNELQINKTESKNQRTELMPWLQFSSTSTRVFCYGNYLCVRDMIQLCRRNTILRKKLLLLKKGLQHE